ncbi:hypothetical protein [Zavarzinia sp. CC-PAN008]|uniref:hypothetical protein n=1 Tax=Zavarzinia sp. CC-PAN008 TaxID=3243332 RepID=UPI003F749C7F
MPNRDLAARQDAAVTLTPAVRTNGTTTGSTVDLRGFDAAMVVVGFGAWTDGTHTPSLEASADGTTFAPVGTADLRGTFAAATGTAAAGSVQRVGYLGPERYVRARMVVAGATSGAASVGFVHRGYPAQGPV